MHGQALELYKSILGLDHSETLGSMKNLVIVLNSQGRYEEASKKAPEAR